MRLQYQEPRHECSRCKPGFPPEMDGTLPWRDEGGDWHTDCPWLDLQDAVAMLKHYENWRTGHSPVSTGWVRVVPRPFVDAIDLIRSTTNECEAALAEQRRRAAGG